MTTYQQLVVQLDTFPELVVLKHYEADRVRVHEYEAAVHLQSWFHGCRVRDRLHQLDLKAVVIQQHWRGYLGRRSYRRLLQATVLQAQADYYRHQATLIQKTWRGFRSRLYIFNFAEWKGYLTFVEEQNNDLQVQCGKESRRTDEERKTVCSSEIRHRRALVKTHHMISTKAIPGVYNSPYSRDKVGMERYLASIRFPVHPKKPVKGTEAARAADPGAPNVQGPFLPPLERRQRVEQRRACPSLRAAEPFAHTEEAFKQQRRMAEVHRVSDEPFRSPPARVFPPVLPSVHAAVPYQRPPQFRQTDRSRFVVARDFRRVLQPVATFDGCL
ncbi:spermatogenesis-associated protein 17-like [Pollicipes pollicipes]|uniref:spermatogenesis-associated protein 17-like n=1 Tax=Pollicipes pollicipes TaxID=41117 RepID=UPI001884B6F6|nr:spermatogenesis-associated protein 17-like [Pollicipes pollicipes]